jgi:hypothetical protein
MRNLEYPITLRTLLKRFLTKLASGKSDAERLKREERKLRARIAAFSAGDRLPREDVHGRPRRRGHDHHQSVPMR